MKKEIASSSAGLLYLTALLLVVSLFTPIWRIELDAPQYPEGLVLKIHAGKLGGDVEIINGLNHYIGMATLHAEDFIEFTVLPYVIAAFALMFIVVAWMGKRKPLYASFWAFVLFGIIAMVDFYRWEYEYGHNLDPNAAIIVPGMAYQPPLIGFKQLLNFGAYSIPDIGGWMFLAGGLFVLLSVLHESALAGRLFNKRTHLATLGFFLAITQSCVPSGPVPIRLQSDPCDFCKMTIVDGRFGAELITSKGRVQKYDDVSCMVKQIKMNKMDGVTCFVHDFAEPGTLQPVSEMFFIHSDAFRSPMGGNVAAFHDEKLALENSAGGEKDVLNWTDVLGLSE